MLGRNPESPLTGEPLPCGDLTLPCGPACVCFITMNRGTGPRYLPARSTKINLPEVSDLTRTIINMSSPNSAPPRTGYTAAVTAAVVVIIALSGAAVALAAAGWKAESIIGLLGAIGTVASLLIAALPRLSRLESQVDQVAHQTNGMMDKRIEHAAETAARRVIAEQHERPRE
jgi:hypothetical protein